MFTSIKRYRWAMLIASLFSLLFTGCASPNVYNNLLAHPITDIEALQFQQPLKQPHRLKSNTSIADQTHTIETSSMKNMTKKPKLGIAFGGGGVRGFMHVGVVKALEEAGIHADLVTGASAGSLIASAYASGMDYQQINEVASSLSFWNMADLVVSHRGLIEGKKIAKLINQHVGNQQNQSRIENMPLPLGIAITDISNQKSLLVTQGNVGQAVQASSSIPGAFLPVHVKQATWVDGSVLNLVPVNFTRAMGADVVIAVDIYCGNFATQLDRHKHKKDVLTMLYHVSRLQTCALSKPEFESADFSISPNFEPKKLTSFSEREASITAGYEATKVLLPKIKARLLIK